MPTARIGDLDMRYETAGSGPPLVLIMGLGCSGDLWWLQVPELSKHFTVLTFDNRGAGATTRPPGPYSSSQMAADTAGLLGHLGIEKTHVLGMSMGGTIAQMLAIEHAHLVDRLVLSCTWCGTNRFGQELLGAWRAVAERAGMDTLLQLNLAQYLTPACFVNQPELVDRLAAGFRAGQQPLEAYLAQNLACQSHAACDRLREILTPTLILTGSRDGQTTVGAAKEMAASIPGSRLEILSGLGHGLMWEDPERYNRSVIAFLTEAERGR